MPGYINRSGNYDFGDLGVVHVNVKSNARNVTARWKGGVITVSAPVGIEYDKLSEIIRGFAPKLQAVKPESLYYIGQTLDFGELSITINRQTHECSRIFANFDGISKGHIDVGADWDMSSADTMKAISRFVCRMAQAIAPMVLIPRAKALADKVGKHPILWTISNGHRLLGHCDTHGTIALSYALIFYPQHLRDYVIYHELAHLSEMNHSPRFHEICNEYCDGRENELHAQMRSHHIPIIR